jgi:hypothetical protein
VPLSLTLTRTFARVNGSRVVESWSVVLSRKLDEQCEDAKPNLERDARHQLGRQLSVLPGVAVAAERAVRLVGLAADEDPELGLLGVLGPPKTLG